MSPANNQRGDPDIERTCAMTATPQHHPSILLIEDDATIRTATARLLQNHGYTVDSVNNGLEAMRLLEAASVANSSCWICGCRSWMAGSFASDNSKIPPCVRFPSYSSRRTTTWKKPPRRSSTDCLQPFEEKLLFDTLERQVGQGSSSRLDDAMAWSLPAVFPLPAEEWEGNGVVPVLLLQRHEGGTGVEHELLVVTVGGACKITLRLVLLTQPLLCQRQDDVVAQAPGCVRLSGRESSLQELHTLVKTTGAIQRHCQCGLPDPCLGGALHCKFAKANECVGIADDGILDTGERYHAGGEAVGRLAVILQETLADLAVGLAVSRLQLVIRGDLPKDNLLRPQRRR